MINRQQRISEFVTSTNRASRRPVQPVRLDRTGWRPDPSLRERILRAQSTHEPQSSKEHKQSLKPLGQPVLIGTAKKRTQPHKVEYFHENATQPKDANQSVEIDLQASRRWKLSPQFAMITAAIFVFGLGVFASVNTLRTNKKVEAQVAQANTTTQTASNNSDTPDERELDPSAVNTYKTDPVLPKTIIIDKINVKARIKVVGTKNNNELIAPSSIYDVGWFEQSSKPGGNGAMLIDGHVHGPTKKGVFYNLKNLVAGDTIQVQRGDGATFTYKVVKTQKFNKDAVDMASTVQSIEPGKPGLNLITCTGSLVKGENTYSERLVVYASLAE